MIWCYMTKNKTMLIVSKFHFQDRPFHLQKLLNFVKKQSFTPQWCPISLTRETVLKTSPDFYEKSQYMKGNKREKTIKIVEWLVVSMNGWCFQPHHS